VAAYRLALQERTRERVPLQWAMTQINLGLALAALGGREAGTARLEEAVVAWDTCLTVIESACLQRGFNLSGTGATRRRPRSRAAHPNSYLVGSPCRIRVRFIAAWWLPIYSDRWASMSAYRRCSNLSAENVLALAEGGQAAPRARHASILHEATRSDLSAAGSSP
jgi:hypothetical protein